MTDDLSKSSGQDSRGRARTALRPIHVAPLVPFLLVTLIATSAIRDNSFLWHVRAGSIQRGLVHVLIEDPFSIDYVGASWRTQSWLVELSYAQLEQWFGGLAWANVMVGAIGAGTIGFIGLAMYRGSRSPIATGFAMVVAVWLAGPFLQPRPVLLSYLLLAALVVILQNRESALWLVVPVIWIWAASHGSWMIGGGLLVLEWLRTSDRKVFNVGLVAFASVFLTAHGAGIWQVVFDFVGAREALAFINEWRAPDLGEMMQAPYLLLISGVIVAAMRRKINARDLIVILPFMFFGMTSQRAIFPAAIVVAPWAILAVPPLRIAKTPGTSVLSGLAMVLVGALAIAPFALRPLGELDHERFPGPVIQAATGGRSVFHDDVVGGFIIYSEWPEQLTFIDDRAELYGAEFYQRFNRARNGVYEDLFADYGFDAALTHDDWGLTERLDADGWVRAVEEGSFVLFYDGVRD